jgi:hypothetical protein
VLCARVHGLLPRSHGGVSWDDTYPSSAGGVVAAVREPSDGQAS